MPQEGTSSLVKVENLKTKGNECFQKNELDEAIQHYSHALVELHRRLGSSSGSGTLLEATLLSNRAACRLKQYESCSKHVTLLEECIQDCTNALSSLDNSTTHDQDKILLHCKLLYRRAKARFLCCNHSSSKEIDIMEYLNNAAKDLLQVLNISPQNTQASTLLQAIRAQHAQEQQEHATPVTKTLHAIFNNGVSIEDQIHHLKVLLGLLTNDLVSTCMELGRRNGVQLLWNHALQETTTEHVKSRTLALQILACACCHPPFCRTYCSPLHLNQDDLAGLVTTNKETNSIAVAALSVFLRLVLYLDVDQDGVCNDDSQVNSGAVCKAILAALDCQNDFHVIRTALDVLTSWTSRDRQALIHAAVDNADSKHALPHKPTEREIRAMKPRELAAYRKCVYQRQQRDSKWAKDRSIQFCSSGGLEALLQCAVKSHSSKLRREMGLVLGRLFSSMENDDDIQKVVTPILSRGCREEDSEQGLTIEEIHEDDDEEKNETTQQANGTNDDETTADRLETIMEKGQLTCSLLLGKSELGVWALESAWSNGSGLSELRELMTCSENTMAMCIASEILSGAASVEKARPLISPLMDSPAFTSLLTSPEPQVQSGAASAIAKMGLADKQLSNNEGEVMGLLQVAVQLLSENEQDDMDATNSNLLGISPAESTTSTAVERGIELLSYLASKTQVKDELAYGFQSVHASTTALEQLVELASTPGAGESTFCYGLATIFALIPVSIETLRREAFVGKDISAEQYDQLQALGKTQEEKEFESKQNLDDEPQAVKERVQKMAHYNIPRAIVKLMDGGASEMALEQLVCAANRMAIEESVRGVMVQQGVLSSCIKLEKGGEEDPSETGKNILRQSRQCVAKLLVTTNPSLLTASQRMGAIKPLMLLLRDHDATDLQQFEALLALTNLASVGDETKNRIVAERGISTLSYAMFSDHEMVRRAATEAMSNLVPHAEMMKHLSHPEKLRLWVAFAGDHEVNYECSRASVGCLAMAVQDATVATTLVGLKYFKDMTMSLLESGKLELMHRVLVLVLNLTYQGEECREAVVSSGVLAFCAAYVDSYHDGVLAEDLNVDRGVMDVTVNIAKDIVRQFG